MFNLIIALIFLAVAGVSNVAQAQDIKQLNDTTFSQLKYRHIGPVGNRLSAVVGVPGDRNIYYVGAASGGVFKTTDGGAHWQPVFDKQPAQSIGALAIDPVNTNVIWAGTGEAHIRSNISIGNGIYKSTDGGKNWTHRGLEKSGRISRIVINPLNPDIVFAAVLGHLYGPQKEKGIFRTIDGGKTWEKVLFVDENTGASDIVMDPNNPEILFAGMWQMVIWTWGRESGGPGSGLYMSRDGGTTWKKLKGKSLPKPPLGKISLAMTAENSNRIYALIETNSHKEFDKFKEHQGVLWRSDNGGDSWKMVNGDHTLAQRPHYYSRVVAAPDDQNEVHFLSTLYTVSLDGGLSIKRRKAGGDFHDMWIDPKLPDRIIIGHDQGVSISNNRGESWFRPQLPPAQMYHVYTDNQIPYYVYGNRQDGPSFRGPSNYLAGKEIPIGVWHSVGGCESGFAVPDPVDNNIVWSGCYEGILDRFDLRTGHSRNVSVLPDNPEGWPASELKYRFQWTFPIAISLHDHNKVYVGSQHVHQTTDGGHSWTVISPDLTTNDKSKQRKSGGLTPDDSSPTYAAVLFAIAESPVEQGLIWAGSNDGLLHVTRDGGATWSNVTSYIPDLPKWGTISNIEPSRYEAGTCYISVDFHQVNNTNPYVYKTTNYGRKWKSISSNIPRSVFSYVHVVREDPVRKSLLYLGTENSIYISYNDGAKWLPLQVNLPHAPVHWLTIQEHFNDLVIATYGRGFWILDDLTPIQQLTDEIFKSSTHFFTPRSAYRFRRKEASTSQPDDPAAGKNPKYGASLHYYLKDKLADSTKVKIDILDQSGQLVKTLDSLSTKKGINRVYWDLKYKASERTKMRTKVLEHAHVEISDDGWRPAGETGRVAPLAPPGDYTLKLIVGDREFMQTLTVLKDPNSAGSEADILEQTNVLLELWQEANAVVELLNEMEWIRKQTYDIIERLKFTDIGNTPDGKEIKSMAKDINQKLVELGMNITDLRMSGGMAGQDRLRWPRQLYAKITSLAGYIGSSDFKPTTQQIEVHESYKDLLENYQRQMIELRGGVIAKFNKLLNDKGINNIITGYVTPEDVATGK